MSKRQRRRYSPEEKAKILRLHLLEQVPISEICEKQGIHPTMFYQWQKALFENAAAALEGQRGTRSTNRQRQAMEAMESKLKRKDEVLAIVVEEMVRLKKKPLRRHELGHHHLGDDRIRLPHAGAGACAGLVATTGGAGQSPLCPDGGGGSRLRGM
jgi:transposase